MMLANAVSERYSAIMSAVSACLSFTARSAAPTRPLLVSDRTCFKSFLLLRCISILVYQDEKLESSSSGMFRLLDDFESLLSCSVIVSCADWSVRLDTIACSECVSSE